MKIIHQPGQMRTGQSVAVFDLDGTLADDRHRSHLIPAPPRSLEGEDGNGVSPWDAYFAEASKDPVHTLIMLMYGYFKSKDCDIWIVTARPSKFSAQTILWLSRMNIQYTLLAMRPPKNVERSMDLKYNFLTSMKLFYGVSYAIAVDDNAGILSKLSLVCDTLLFQPYDSNAKS